MAEEPRTFPPKMFYLVIWIVTFVMAVCGIFFAPKSSIMVWIWAGVALIALRQVWVTRWVQIDRGGIRVRNIAQRGRELQWEAVEEIQEKEVAVRTGKPFRLVKIVGEMSVRPGRRTTITIDSDTVGFDVLLALIRDYREGQ